MKDYPDDLRELYFEFGRAAEMAQVMEMAAGNLALTFMTMCFDTTNITDEKREFFGSLVEDVNKRTFGNLLKQIREVIQIDDGIATIVNDALEKRNYLTHKFYRTHNFAINSEEGRKDMRAIIQEIHEALGLAEKVLSGMTNSLNQLFGRKNITEQDALDLLAKGKKLDI